MLDRVTGVLRATLLGLAMLVLAACNGNTPGPLEGTWSATRPFPVTVSFRPGEVETMGRVRQVAYARDGQDVLVTYLEGANKGVTFRYTVIDADTIRSESGTFRRVR